MSTINSYATLAEFKNWKEITDTNATRDGDVEVILEDASRHLDDQTGHTFYPRIETRYFDIPERGRALCVDDDLLEVISLTNGDGSSVASTEYHLLPKNLYPKSEIAMHSLSSVLWQLSTTTGDEYAIGVNGWWGYHNRYAQRAWKNVGTLGAAITDTTTAGFTMTAGHSVTAGRIYKIDTEIFNVSAVSTNAITALSRGDNGSTAATHLNGATVSEWQVLPQIKTAVLDLAHSVYSRRFGTSSNFSTTITAAGVVLSPRDYSQTVKDVIASFRKKI